MASDIDDQILQDLYSWIDEVPLSRQKRNITRDFSDGVMMAELVKYYFPHLVDLHNFPTANAVTQKKKNWHLLNWKVFKKLNFELSNEVIDSLVSCKPGTVERVLLLIRTKIDRTLYERKRLEAEMAKPALDHTGAQPQLSSRPLRFTERTLGGVGGMSELSSPTSPHRNRFNNTVPPARAGYQPSLVSQTDAVPRVAYEERVQECLSKEEIINVLQAKIRKMEHLLHLKDIRIDELSRRLEGSRPTAVTGAQMPKGQLSRASMAPNALATMPQMQQQQPQLTQAQLQQLQMQLQYGAQFGPPPYGAPNGAGQGGAPPGAFPFNGNLPPFMPLPPISQPQAQTVNNGNAPQAQNNDQQNTVYSSDE